MDSLQEIYKTLLRRGMPPHPELRYSGGAWCLIQGHIDPNDARDLLAMCAVRWINNYSLGLRCGIAGDGNAEAALKLAVEMTSHMEPTNVEA